MKTYEILRDGNHFAGFEEGQPGRLEGEVIDDQFMLQEFDDCVKRWAHENYKRAKRWRWELRIIQS